MDNKHAGKRTTNGRMRDVYDQSHQEAIVKPKLGVIPTEWWIGSGASGGAMFLFLLFVWPRIAHIFPLSLLGMFIRIPPLPGGIINILLYSLFVSGVTFGLLYLSQESNQALQRYSPELLAHDYNMAFLDVPEELPEKYDIVPDNKAHFDLNVTSLLSHIMLKQTHSIRGKDGRVRFDEKFGQSLFDVAHLPKTNPPRIVYDAAKLNYNPNNKFGKSEGRTVEDAINNYWHVPDCEDPNSQDPTGAYIVSTAPENTVLVSETRGGKGQKYIEIILDIWSRQDKKPNIVTTDLKMELLRMSLKTFTIRGYDVRSLNLLVDHKTDAINFIGYAVNSAIRGDITKMGEQVTNIADIYFPKGGSSQDPMWNNAASTVFKRTVYGLIDYYNEEVHRLKDDPNLSLTTVKQKADEAWGHVTLFNSYKFIVETAAKTYPRSVFEKIYPKDKDGNTTDPDPEAEYKSGLTVYFDATAQLPQNPIREQIANQNNALKSSAKSEKMLASIYGICLFGLIFFTDTKVINLTSARPSQNLDLDGFSYPRRLAVRFDNIYANEHNYFHTTTVWTIYHDAAQTKPYVTKNSKGETVIDEKYYYEGEVDGSGWAEAVFEGKFNDGHYVKKKIRTKVNGQVHVEERDVFVTEPTYIRLQLFSSNQYVRGSDMNLKLGEYWFKFEKDYRKSYNGRHYLINPLTGKREVQGGTLVEYTYNNLTKRINTTGSFTSRTEHSLIIGENGNVYQKQYPIINDVDVHYSDKPIALFLVAPPSTASYNKILLVAIDLIYNQQVSNAYTKTSDQKPMYDTKYMLDEFGNMQSDGHGVPNLEAKLSSGLGQNQQFTLVLQSLKQLEAVYGDNVAQILKANVAKFFYMKSKDKDMINMLMDMNGKKYVYQESSMNFDTPDGGYHLGDIFGTNKDTQRPRHSTTVTREERPVISENDYLRLNNDAADGNAIVTTGQNPVLSMEQSIMPMSFALLKNRTGGKGEDANNQNPPTMADTSDFDPLQNLPNFDEMVALRIDEAEWAPKVREQYKKVYHKSDRDIQLMDANIYSDIIMRGIHANIDYEKKKSETITLDQLTDVFDSTKDEKLSDQFENMSEKQQEKVVENTIASSEDIVSEYADNRSRIRDLIRNQAQNKAAQIHRNNMQNTTINRMRNSVKNNDDFKEKDIRAEHARREEKNYADGNLCYFDILGTGDLPQESTMSLLALAYADCIRNFRTDSFFRIKENEQGGNDLYDKDGNICIIDTVSGGAPEKRYQIQKQFAKDLVSFDNWAGVAGGAFDRAVANYYRKRQKDFENDN